MNYNIIGAALIVIIIIVIALCVQTGGARVAAMEGFWMAAGEECARLGVDSQLLYLDGGSGYLIVGDDIANCPLTYTWSGVWGLAQTEWDCKIHFDFGEFNDDPPLPLVCDVNCSVRGIMTITNDGEIYARLRRKVLE